MPIEEPTPQLRYVTRSEYLHDRQGNAIAERPERVLQQKWQITECDGSTRRTEWRDVPLEAED